VVSGKAIGFKLLGKEVREEKKAESSRQKAVKRMIGLKLKANRLVYFFLNSEGGRV
jgi:hypothetical protein